MQGKSGHIRKPDFFIMDDTRENFLRDILKLTEMLGFDSPAQQETVMHALTKKEHSTGHHISPTGASKHPLTWYYDDESEAQVYNLYKQDFEYYPSLARKVADVR